MELTTLTKQALLRACRTEKLQIDGLISCASQMGCTAEELIVLLEDASEYEPGTTRGQKLSSLLVRSFCRGRMTREEIAVWALELGLDGREVSAMVTEALVGLAA